MTIWTTPRTWVVAESPTAANFNTHVRDNLNFLYGKPMCSLYQATPQSISASTWTAVAFDAEFFDNSTMHDTSSNNTRITPTAAGMYLLLGYGAFEPLATTLRTRFLKNAADIIGTSVASFPVSVDNNGAPAFSIINLGTADYVEMQIHQSSAGTAVTQEGIDGVRFVAEWVCGP